jgi:hypothetical protein
VPLRLPLLPSISLDIVVPGYTSSQNSKFGALIGMVIHLRPGLFPLPDLLRSKWSPRPDLPKSLGYPIK